MTNVIDHEREFTIELTGGPPETKIPWALLGVGLIALYFLFRKKG